MIAVALLLASDVPGAWVPVGVSTSRLRVFVERASLRIAGDVRQARVRIGSPTVIAGSIVVVYQNEEIDCRAQTWRMTGYEAFDADAHLVRHDEPTTASAMPPLPATAGTIGGRVVATVCAM